MEQQLYELPEGWGWSELGENCALENGDRGKNYPSRAAFISAGIPVINAGNLSDTGIDTSTLNYISRERFDLLGGGKVREGDILFCLRGSLGKSAIVKGISEGAIASSLVIVRPDDCLDRDYLQAYFKSHLCMSMIEKYDNGAAQPNLSSKSLKRFQLPLPPLNEQKRIVAKLDALFTRIDAAITHLQETLELSKALFASALDEVFVEGASQWKKAPLSQVAVVARGKSKHRPRNDKSLFDGVYPFIQTGDVRNAGKYIQSYSTTYNEKGLAQSRLWPKGTICLTIAANIGEVAILGMDACFPDSVVGISSDTESNEYIYYFLTTLQQHLDSKANAAAQKNINLRILSEIEIPVPSIGEQVRIANYLDALAEHTQTFEAETQERIDQLTDLKSSLLDAAFRGQLSTHDLKEVTDVD